MEYFKVDEELIYLGFYFKQKLWLIDGVDFVSIDIDYGGIIDWNYYFYKIGVLYLFFEKDDFIVNSWKDLLFDVFINEIKFISYFKVIDIIFCLFDWFGDVCENVIV